MDKILLTGGLGYIGSHTAVVLANAGYSLILLDNLSNCELRTRERLSALIGKECDFIEGDVRDGELLRAIFQDYQVDAVIHFAGVKSVEESVLKPLKYYDVNVGGLLSLVKAMEAAAVRNLIFSSSATVYGNPQYLPLDELHPTSALTPYARTKLQSEQILSDLTRPDEQEGSDNWKIASLRYFNPVGAHDSGLIGEQSKHPPSNLMPRLVEVATGRQKELIVHGNDYDTPDGTGVRDFIHVMDLAQGHRAALEYLQHNPSHHIFNLGTGKGYSVCDLVESMESVTGMTLPIVFGPRRRGDSAACFADATKAETMLGWRATKQIREMCESAWRAAGI